MMINLAVLGATGLVGQKMRKILRERNVPFDHIFFFASKNSAGKKLYFKDAWYNILELTKDNLKQCGITHALSALDSPLAKEFLPYLAELGAIIVDNSSAFRMDDDVPLVVPEINLDAVEGNLIASPNCSTIQSVVALKPIYDAFGIKRIIYTTYQAVAGSGINGVEDLVRGDYNIANTFYPHPIAHNLLPHIDDFLDDGYTKEEMKMVNETRKIFNDQEIAITATAVRVPVFESHMVSIVVETKEPFTMDQVLEAFQGAQGVIVEDDVAHNVYPMPLNTAGKDEVFVGRIRRDHSVANGLNFICVADNTRKGAALNTIQILEKFITK
ncbi:aspartate-semialdehyde dehydrogenase [Peptoniphilus equinus]|uniref:Aspartate-semialdehyde dehydrogenase n=1 Tax=Peptoniphilus equinus TaxID=3016343 RepID=A0ABY7QWW2_9FIRM|nr:aspartate-semialdehyde dehydrogenase [Peptoniphilus equinus]WBW50760.1 aspartate-semialdehyde dehydrogenase [Peptoniphilus equinus]